MGFDAKGGATELITYPVVWLGELPVKGRFWIAIHEPEALEDWSTLPRVRLLASLGVVSFVPSNVTHSCDCHSDHCSRSLYPSLVPRSVRSAH